VVAHALRELPHVQPGLRRGRLPAFLAVELTVADTGPGAGGQPDERRGSGLRGMRERVAMLGGTPTAGDGPDGGFQVRARLPLAGQPLAGPP
jgi:signal transduction histidine kinase